MLTFVDLGYQHGLKKSKVLMYGVLVGIIYVNAKDGVATLIGSIRRLVDLEEFPFPTMDADPEALGESSVWQWIEIEWDLLTLVEKVKRLSERNSPQCDEVLRLMLSDDESDRKSLENKFIFFMAMNHFLATGEVCVKGTPSIEAPCISVSREYLDRVKEMTTESMIHVTTDERNFLLEKFLTGL